jgi:hypothetical protein
MWQFVMSAPYWEALLSPRVADGRPRVDLLDQKYRCGSKPRVDVSTVSTLFSLGVKRKKMEKSRTAVARHNTTRKVCESPSRVDTVDTGRRAGHAISAFREGVTGPDNGVAKLKMGRGQGGRACTERIPAAEIPAPINPCGVLFLSVDGIFFRACLKHGELQCQPEHLCKSDSRMRSAMRSTTTVAKKQTRHRGRRLHAS